MAPGGNPEAIYDTLIINDFQNLPGGMPPDPPRRKVPVAA